MPVESWSQIQHPYHALQDLRNIVQEGQKECKQNNEGKKAMKCYLSGHGVVIVLMNSQELQSPAKAYSHGWGKGS